MILPIYAALSVFLFIFLSFRVISLRHKHHVAIGGEQHKDLARAMRVQGNFAEYVPFTLFLLYLLEVSSAPAWSIHALGSALLIGRIFHAYGVSQVKENLRFRQIGMVLTFLVKLFSAIGLLVLQF